MVTPPVASPGASEWKKMKVQELRDELASRGLDTSGLKAALIERLEATGPTNEDGNAANDEKKDMDLDTQDCTSIDQSAVKQATGQPVAVDASMEVAEVEGGAKLEPAADIAQTTEKTIENSVAPVAPVGLPSQEATPGNAVVPSTDLEKKQRRAERFGLELLVSEDEKRRLRAARFGDVKTNGTSKASTHEEASKMSPTLKDAEAIKRKARAARFGIEEVPEKCAPIEAEAAKKKARLARFGLEIKLDPLEQEKKKVRAARFGLLTEAKPIVGSEKEVPIEQLS